MDELNSQQKKAVETEGHCLVTACPGAGKTKVLSYRAARLLKQNPKGNLIAVTFTRDAALSLKDRILAQAGNSTKIRVGAGTFHSLSLNLLKKAGVKVQLASPAEQSLLIRRAAEHTRDPIKYDEAVEAIEHIKSSMDAAPPAHTSPGAEAYHLYQEYLQQAGLHDFSDLLILAVLSMRDGSVKPYKVDWLLGDESQDMDEVQMAWVMEHAKAGVETMLVADDDQSIYGWRHAQGYRGLIKYREQLDAHLVTLPINYRCDQIIIQTAAKMIEFNTERVPKDVVGASKSPGRLETHVYGDRIAEAEAVVAAIAKGSPDGAAVLARTNQLLYATELKLVAHGIPYYRTGGRSLWDQEAPGTIMGLLDAVSNKKHTGLVTALHFAGIPVTVIESVIPPDKRNSYHQILSALQNPPARAAKTGSLERERVVSLGRLCVEWGTLVKQGRTQLAIAGVSLWVRGFLTPQHPSYEICEWLTDTLMRLPGTLKMRLSTLQKPKKKEQNGVALATLHGAKGLEWDRVWMVATEYGVLPHPDSPKDEERRLCYVGVTRARHELYISWQKKQGPSQFLEEAGLLEPVSTEEKKEELLKAS